MTTYRDVLYGRISEDEAGTERGVHGQLEDGRELSTRRDGIVVGEYSDNDISALRGDHRPGYEALLDEVRAGNVDRIVVFHTSRIWRNRRERAEGIELLQRHRIALISIKGPDLDMSSAAGRMIAGILGEFDTGESELKAERIQRAALTRANEGRANGPVAYGWRREYTYNSSGVRTGYRDVVDEEKAGVVREIVRRLLAGEALKSIQADFNGRGIPAPGVGWRPKVVRDGVRGRGFGQDEDGSRWGKTAIRKLALRPANVGQRVYHRGRPDERIISAEWPAIITPDDHAKVLALLNDPKRVKSRPGSRVWLLTYGDLGVCGVCGSPLRVSRRGNVKYGTKQLLYLCAAHECVGRSVESVDRYVGCCVVEILSRQDVAAALSGDARRSMEALERAEALRARLATAAGEFADEKITSEQLAIITAKLKTKIQASEVEAARTRPAPVATLVGEMIGQHAADRWGGLDVNQRRAVLQALGMRVTILPVQRRGPGFDPSSVVVAPRRRLAVDGSVVSAVQSGHA
jgi:DNA invertase Pin-like site-specific DNA recombinase